MSIEDIRAAVNGWNDSNPRKATRKGIQRCSELDRILLLRTRDAFANADILVDELTQVFRRPGGAQTLRPAQAVALYEMAETNGLVSPIRVGGGKTLVSLLAPRVFQSQRPLLLLPAKLVDKTRREIATYAKHWHIATNVRIESYERLSRTGAATFLEEYRPDLIVCDEAQKLRHTNRSVTRRVRRYVTAHMPRFVVLSGTLIRKRLGDWAHLAAWALHEGSPAPRKQSTVVSWGMALDEGGKAPAGALQAFGDPYREAYAQRIIATPGVVATRDSLPGVSLYVGAYRLDLPPALQEALHTLDSDWTLPDGHAITDSKDVWRAMRQLEMGCYYRWITRPPEGWADARLEWSRFVRNTIRYSRAYDSELQVRQAALSGTIDRAAWDGWAAVKDTFAPVTECVWVDDYPVRAMVAAAQETPLLLWLHHTEIGKRFAQYGLPYYGAGGTDAATGRYVESENGTRSIALSIASNYEGRNLQAFAYNIVAEMPRDASMLEQLLGRTHRDAQEAEEVYALFHRSTRAADVAWERVIEHARYLAETTQQPQKLLEATEI